MVARLFYSGLRSVVGRLLVGVVSSHVVGSTLARRCVEGLLGLRVG